jgi:hypothetical protein
MQMVALIRSERVARSASVQEDENASQAELTREARDTGLVNHNDEGRRSGTVSSTEEARLVGGDGEADDKKGGEVDDGLFGAEGHEVSDCALESVRRPKPRNSRCARRYL